MNEQSHRTLLLHCCCAPCMTHPVRLLRKEFDVTAFFYNPNIHPREEYTARQNEMERMAEEWEIPLIIGEYDVDEWFKKVKGYEEEPEGGLRCEACYRFRLEKTVLTAEKRGVEVFGTTLSISPHKKVTVINAIGKELEERRGICFFEADFKKKNGFKISCRLSNEEGLYRQNYCGCTFSRRQRT